MKKKRLCYELEVVYASFEELSSGSIADLCSKLCIFCASDRRGGGKEESFGQGILMNDDSWLCIYIGTAFFLAGSHP